MMETITPWRTLKLETGGRQVLVKTRFDPEGYDIQLTDLSRVWGERLNRQSIVERAVSSRCSIEPSEQDQYEKFIEKIASALESKKETTLDLQTTSDGLSLHLSAPLPKPLPSFKWSIELRRLPDHAVAVDVVNPLLILANTLQHQLQHLVDELAAKDHVISKVTDRLEQSKIQLQEIFPTVSNVKLNQKSKKSQREQLSGHVKGLAAFDEDSWRASLASTEVPSDISSDLLDVILKDAPAHRVSSHQMQIEDEWWKNLDSAQSTLSFRHNESRQGDGTGNKGVVPAPKAQSGPEEGLSQQTIPPKSGNRQATPSTDDDDDDGEPEEGSRNAYQKSSAPHAREAEDTTEDEDDLDEIPVEDSSQTKTRRGTKADAAESTKPTNASKRLGMMGGRKAASSTSDAAPEVSPDPQPKKASKLGTLGGKGKAKPHELNHSRDSEHHEKQESSPTKPKAKLGAFGGRAKHTRRSSSPETAAVSSPKAKTKLGTFGGKSKKANDVRPDHGQDESAAMASAEAHDGGQASATAEAELDRPSRSSEKTEVEQERENSEERADKKRERLKRELEEKSKAPVKKKRKF